MFTTEIIDETRLYSRRITTYCCIENCEGKVQTMIAYDMIEASDGEAIRYLIDQNERRMEEHLWAWHKLYTENAWRKRVDDELRPWMEKIIGSLSLGAGGAEAYDLITGIREHFMRRDSN